LVVNGVAIPESTVDALLGRLHEQGVTITSQVRDQVLGELTLRQLTFSEAEALGLEKSQAFQVQLAELRYRLLADMVFADYLAKNPISEAEEHAEYARQKKLLGGGDTTPQYLLSQIVVKSETEARELIARAKKGESFEKLSKVSLDEGSKAHGGQVGWLFPNDILPAIGAAPIQIPSGWSVVKVDDIRPFKLPGFEESRPQLLQALQAQRRQSFVESLSKKAVIQRQSDK
jgi:peptidyl-prolyl cis-trans isomerase C